MKQFRMILIGAFITLAIGVVLGIVGISLPADVYKDTTRNVFYLIAAVFVITFVFVLYAAYKYYKDHKSEIKEEIETSKSFKKGTVDSKTANALKDEMALRWKAASAEIGKVYDTTLMPSSVGIAKFVQDGLEFEVEGKYTIVKDFKGTPGDHFAFEITSTKMTKKPEDYDDVCDYESIGFRISVGYFDDTPLSDYENENGVILTDTAGLEGKIFELNYDCGYDFQIITVEMDPIEKGQIKFLKWNDNEKLMAFKFSVPWGVHDVVAGAVSLKEDKEI